MWLSLTLLIFAAIALVDWRIRRIPHAVTLCGLLIAILTHQTLPAQFLLNSVIGAAAGFGLFWGVRAAAAKVYGEDALGFGDVMLAGLIGAVGGIEIGAHALVLGIFMAGAYSLVALFWGWVSRRDTLPYGTFLALGAIVRFIYWQL